MEDQHNFINEFQKKHYEAVTKEQESLGRHRLSAAQLKEQALRARAIAEAKTGEEKERLRAQFQEWNRQGKPVADKKQS